MQTQGARTVSDYCAMTLIRLAAGVTLATSIGKDMDVNARRICGAMVLMVVAIVKILLRI
jgi:hypothetical protein